MKKINFDKKVQQIDELYSYHKIAEFNNHMMTVVKVENRTLDFHTHPDSDEVFWVMEGAMQLEFESEIVDISKGEMVVVPKDTLHRPVCNQPCTCLLIEKQGTLTSENTGGVY